MLRIWQHILSLSYRAYVSIYKFVHLICFFIFPYSSKSTKENITAAGLDWEPNIIKKSPIIHHFVGKYVPNRWMLWWIIGLFERGKKQSYSTDI